MGIGHKLVKVYNLVPNVFDSPLIVNDLLPCLVKHTIFFSLWWCTFLWTLLAKQPLPLGLPGCVLSFNKYLLTFLPLRHSTGLAVPHFPCLKGSSPYDPENSWGNQSVTGVTLRSLVLRLNWVLLHVFWALPVWTCHHWTKQACNQRIKVWLSRLVIAHH